LVRYWRRSGASASPHSRGPVVRGMPAARSGTKRLDFGEGRGGHAAGNLEHLESAGELRCCAPAVTWTSIWCYTGASSFEEEGLHDAESLGDRDGGGDGGGLDGGAGPGAGRVQEEV